MDFKKVYFDSAESAMQFADKYWHRVFNIHYSDDYDGRYWIVHIIKSKES